MGCCASKEQEDAVITKGGEAAAFTGAVAGGAAIGAAISGPAAPIGAAVGGVVGAIVGKATAGTVGKVVSVPVGMLNDVWRGLLNRQEVLELLPDIGMLKTERAVYPPAMSDLSSTNSYLYQTHGTAIAGLPYMQALRGEPLTDAQRKSLSLAVRRLEAKKVVAITGDCGAMLHYQHQVAALSMRPVLLSALLQAPLLATTFKSDEQARRAPRRATAPTASQVYRYLAPLAHTRVAGARDHVGQDGDDGRGPQVAAPQDGPAHARARALPPARLRAHRGLQVVGARRRRGRADRPRGDDGGAAAHGALRRRLAGAWPPLAPRGLRWPASTAASAEAPPPLPPPPARPAPLRAVGSRASAQCSSRARCCPPSPTCSARS